MRYDLVPFDNIRIFHLEKMSPAVKEYILPVSLGTFGTEPCKFYFTAVEKSIHYHTIDKKDFTLYNEFVTSTKQLEHSQATFQSLIDNFDIEKLSKIKVRKFLNHPRLFVEDGCHRLAVIKHKGMFSWGIPLKYFEFSYCPATVNEIGDMLKKTTQTSLSNGWNNARAPYGYHSFNISNIVFEGQRNPTQRLDKMRSFVDFTSKKVLDLGCNTGGMLFHLQEISHGYGVDLDSSCISAANFINDTLIHAPKYEFEVGDLNKFTVHDFCEKHFTPDIIFLFSIGSWVSNWAQLYKDALQKAKTIILETNNDAEGRAQLDLFLFSGANVRMIADKSDDDRTGNDKRKTYLITK